VIITGEPNELVAQIHTRIPVILPPETHKQWLSGEFGKEILRPFPAEEMTARPISKRINKPENNDPSVLEEGEMENYRSAELAFAWSSVLLQARHQRAIFGRKARFKANQLLVWAGTDISKARSLPAPIGVTLIESGCASSSTLNACAGPNEASPTVLGPDV
jgi:SOS response associated peptidase (SRAP)